jgi:uncharacterized membrane protein HdeD (DUF308 family)
MNTHLTLKKTLYVSNRWWLSMLLGILFIVTGIWLMTNLLDNYAALSMLFSFLLLLSGIMEILSSVSLHKGSNKPMLMGGIIDVTTGLILVSAPLLYFLILSFFVGFAPLFRSLMAIDPTFDLQKNYDRKWGILVLVGIAGLIFSLVLLEKSVADLTMIFCTGLAFIGIGAMRIVLGFRLKWNMRMREKDE